MKHIEHYLSSATITILPNPLKHLNTIRLEINPNDCERNDYLDIFKDLLNRFRKEYGFSVSTDSHLGFNNTQMLNVMEFVLPLYANEAEIAKDISEEVEEIFGKDSVINRVTIKKELRK